MTNVNSGITVLGGVGLALVLSVFAKVALSAMLILLPGIAAAKLVATMVVGCYLLVLLAKSRLRNGKLIAFFLWCTVSTAMLLSGTPLLIFAAAQLALLWLIRSLCHYTSLIAAGLDAALVGAGALATLWAYGTTGSVLLAVWCFFLVQALFSLIPKTGLPQRQRSVSAVERTVNARQFQQACRSAETALLQLSKAQS